MHLDSYLRDITGGMRSPWHLHVDTSRSFFFSTVITVAKKFENTVQPVIEFCFQSRAIEDVGHDAFWLAC